MKLLICLLPQLWLFCGGIWRLVNLLQRRSPCLQIQFLGRTTNGSKARLHRLLRRIKLLKICQWKRNNYRDLHQRLTFIGLAYLPRELKLSKSWLWYPMIWKNTRLTLRLIVPRQPVPIYLNIALFISLRTDLLIANIQNYRDWCYL